MNDFIKNDMPSPALIMVMGLPGSGKSYFSRAFAKKIGGVHYNSDIIRKQHEQHPAYTESKKSEVYQIMFQVVCQALEAGKIVVVDATFSLQRYRDIYVDYVTSHQIPLKIIVVTASEKTIIERLKTPRPDSDADYQVYRKIRSEFEPINSDHLQLNSDGHTLEELLEKAAVYLNK